MPFRGENAPGFQGTQSTSSREALDQQQGRFERDCSILENSVVAAKLDARRAAGKPLDLIVSDVDGTLYMRGTRGVYTGKNRELAQQLREKNIPFIINTGRPVWNQAEDANFGYDMDLPKPDAVIAGTGTAIYWRQKNGKLCIDETFAERMNNHLIFYEKEGVLKSARFNPHQIARILRPELEPFIQSGQLRKILVDEGPMLPDGTFGNEGLRFVLVDLDPQTMKKLKRSMQDRISGIKIDICEMGDYATANSFTGWMHLVPSIAGKEKAAKYVLERIREGMALREEKLHAHALGDASNDIRVLAAGSHPTKDPYVLHQYGLGNLQSRAHTILKKVADAAARSVGADRRQSQLILLEAEGPDGVYEVVNGLL